MSQEVHRIPSRGRRLCVEVLEDRRMLAVLTVHNNLDDTLANLAGDGELSLREAIEVANNPGTVIDGFVSNDVEDTIEFARPYFDEPRTIFLADGELLIGSTLTIDGPGQELLTIDAQQNSRVIRFFGLSGGSLSLNRLVVTGGQASGGSQNDGGGILFESGSALTINQTRIEGNRTSSGGGGIYLVRGDLTVIDSTLTGNFSHGVGGGLTVGTHADALHLIRSEVSDNRSVYNGAGIFVRGTNSPAVFTNSIIARNVSERLGGGIESFSEITLSESSLVGNRSTYSAAGINAYAADVIVSNSTISGNVSGDAAGGILTRQGDITVTNSTMSGNFAPLREGSAIRTSSGSIRIEKTTITQNVTGDANGVIFISRPGSIYLPSLAITDSIIAENFDGSGVLEDLVQDLGSRLVIENSLIGATSLTVDVTDNQIGSIENPIDPLLGPLADNGGPTQTHALLPGSPAIDAGDPTIQFDPNEFDQRGAPFLRVADGNFPNDIAIDIGAYEAQSIPSADFDSDSDVDGTDFLAWQRGFGTANAVRADGNSDDDADVDASDLAAWQVSYGEGGAVTVTSAPTVGRERLIDAALALVLVEDATEEQSLFYAANDLGEEIVVSSTGIALPVVPGASALSEAELLFSEPTDSRTAEDPWLADELLEGAFG